VYSIQYTALSMANTGAHESGDGGKNLVVIRHITLNQLRRENLPKRVSASNNAKSL
jgi:hypothetical protein